MSGDTLQLRHHRPFVAFWFARICTPGSYHMLTVAIGWHLYSLTGNVLDLGLVGLVEFLPRVLFMLHTGHVADRYDRRRVAALCQTGQGLIALVLLVGSLNHAVTRELIFILAFCLGTARAFEQPTTQALLPNIVPPAIFPRAIAAAASAMQGATIIAPALGGLLYALGAAWVYGPAVVLYGIAILLVSSLPARQTPSQKEKPTLDNLLAGIRFIKSRPDVLGAISLDLFAVLLGGATALLPVFAADILLTGPWGLGLLRSAPAVGALGMSFLLAYVSLNRHVGRIRRSFGQLVPPDAMRGRLSAVTGLFIGASNQLGEFESGVTAHFFGTVPAVVLGGVGTLVITGVWMKLFPGLAKRDRLTAPPQDS